MSTREENVRRILRDIQNGKLTLADLNRVDREDLKAFDSLNLWEWDRTLSGGSQLYGDLTLREVQKAKQLSDQLPASSGG